MTDRRSIARLGGSGWFAPAPPVEVDRSGVAGVQRTSGRPLVARRRVTSLAALLSLANVGVWCFALTRCYVSF